MRSCSMTCSGYPRNEASTNPSGHPSLAPASASSQNSDSTIYSASPMTYSATWAIEVFPEQHCPTGGRSNRESRNDYYRARYYASGTGRWISPDWSAKVEPVPYAKLDDPQTLNLYAYLGDNPLSGVDATGHGWWKNFRQRVANFFTFHGWKTNAQLAKVTATVTSARVLPSGASVPGNKAPDQVQPGVKNLKGTYTPSDRPGSEEPYSAHYDDYGRQIGRTDYTGQPDPSTHPDPHYHTREYGPGYGPKGKESGPFPGEHPNDSAQPPSPGGGPGVEPVEPAAPEPAPELPDLPIPFSIDPF